MKQEMMFRIVDRVLIFGTACVLLMAAQASRPIQGEAIALLRQTAADAHDTNANTRWQNEWLYNAGEKPANRKPPPGHGKVSP